jgi:hypothetical protein
MPEEAQAREARYAQELPDAQGMQDHPAWLIAAELAEEEQEARDMKVITALTWAARVAQARACCCDEQGACRSAVQDVSGSVWGVCVWACVAVRECVRE